MKVGDTSAKDQRAFLWNSRYLGLREVECRCGAGYVIKPAPFWSTCSGPLPTKPDTAELICYCGLRLPFRSGDEIIAAVPPESRYDQKRFRQAVTA